MAGLSKIGQFRATIWDYYHDHGRDLPWRHDPTPYQVFISEVMLQQTQVNRVLVKYAEWIQAFPSFEALAEASVAEVVAAWQGLGYNRRALWTWRAAQMVVSEYGGALPQDPAVLVKLPGVGPNTAGSIAAFAYEVPVVFIETNIRRVFIYHYEELGGGFGGSDSAGRRTRVVSSPGPVSELAPAGAESSPTSLYPLAQDRVIADKELLPLIEAALDCEHPREWYYALMDYGADLAKRVPNPNRQSKHYAVQSKFEGSVRQIRGEVLRRLLASPKTAAELGIKDERLQVVLEALVKEGFVEVGAAGKYFVNRESKNPIPSGIQ